MLSDEAQHAATQEQRARQIAEAEECKVFLASPAWEWLKGHLERAQARYIAQSTARGLPDSDRHILLGKLALATEIITRPEKLVHFLSAPQEPEAEGDMQRPAPYVGQPGVL